MFSLSDFDYTLPQDRIAQTPVEPRDASKLLIVDRRSQTFTDKHFYDLADVLTPNDVLVLNDTKVFPARLLVQKENGKPVEILLQQEVRVTENTITWSCLTKPGLKENETISIPNTHVTGICTKVDGYLRHIQFSINREQFFILIDKWAKTPIPPYIRWDGKDEHALRERYQTVYAQTQGAVAAPTAGLHFTPTLLDRLEKKGVQIEKVTLHVGLGTFLPVKTDNITEHHIHAERFELSQPVAERLNDAKASGKRIIAVGTTVVRVLESCVGKTPALSPQAGETSIYIHPPYQFLFVDSLITNFHTPKSTLLMLVSAFVSHPNSAEEFSTFSGSLIGKAYQYALEQDYRFYSFGDSMWIQ